VSDCVACFSVISCFLNSTGYIRSAGKVIENGQQGVYERSCLYSALNTIPTVCAGNEEYFDYSSQIGLPAEGESNQETPGI
jgi:hypothetical protein